MNLPRPIDPGSLRKMRDDHININIVVILFAVFGLIAMIGSQPT
jgi:hypothetical protein